MSGPLRPIGPYCLENSVLGDVGRYEKLDLPLWRHPGFTDLSEVVLPWEVLTGGGER